MGKSSSNDELTIRNQFDRICKLALKGEAADYYRHIAYRQKHEVLFSELSQKELDSIFGVDKYTVENKCFRVLGYDIEVKDTLLAEAIQSLSENKRKVVLLSYFMDMSDADIAVAVIHSNDFDVVQFSHLVCTSLCLFVFIKNAPFSRFALK